MLGDFNCVLNIEERLGSPMTMAEVREFRECVGKCDLQNIRYSGSYYTWNNKQPGGNRVYSKIDRVLVNHECISDLPTSAAKFLHEGLYDHCPVIIHWDQG